MKYPKFQYNKRRLFASLLALSVSQIPIVQAATIGSPTVETLTSGSTFSMDANATDFYIFGENVKKKDGGTLFSDVSGPLSNQKDSDVRIAWTGGDPTLSATGSTKYDVCKSGKGFKSPAPGFLSIHGKNA